MYVGSNGSGVHSCLVDQTIYCITGRTFCIPGGMHMIFCVPPTSIGCVHCMCEYVSRIMYNYIILVTLAVCIANTHTNMHGICQYGYGLAI